MLRLYNIADFSITADEVSAINRAQFSSFRELIQLGVLTDTHPMAVQFFLYCWIKVVGISTVAVRIPFVLDGILSVWIIFLIAKKWFNETTALLSAAALALLEYTIVYSQLARPYAPGLLYSLLAVLCWTAFVFENKQDKAPVFWGFVVSVAVALYTHYFSALFVVMVFISGLFFIKKHNLKKYLLAGVCIFLIWLPHIGITMKQLAMRGVGGPDGWLDAPKPDFIINYFIYAFNNSLFVIVLIGVIFLGSILFSFSIIKWKKFHSLCLIWFVIPYLAGYFYSVYINPLLQYSILIFSFPFLLLFLFSFVPIYKNEKWHIAFILLFTSGLLYSTVCQNKYYSTNKFGVLSDVAENIIESNEKYGERNITRTINLVGPYSIHYCLSQHQKKTTFKSYMNNGREELFEFKKIIDSASTPYFIYAWSTRFCPYEIPEMIKDKYPVILERKWYYNSEFYLFAKGNAKNDSALIFLSKNDFEVPDKSWNYANELLTDSACYLGSYSAKLTDVVEYGPTYRVKVKDICSSVNDIINISTMAMFADENTDAELVVSFERDGKSYDWSSNRFSFFLKEKNVWRKIYLSKRLPDAISLNDEIVIYVWNNAKKTIFIDDMQVKVTKGNSNAYGKRKEFER